MLIARIAGNTSDTSRAGHTNHTMPSNPTSQRILTAQTDQIGHAELVELTTLAHHRSHAGNTKQIA